MRSGISCSATTTRRGARPPAGTLPLAYRGHRGRPHRRRATCSIGEISGVDVLGTLSQANPGWLAVAVLASAVTYLGAAIGIAAFVPKRLSIWRGFFVQLATAFVGVAMPPTVGHVAVNARYLHKQKVDEGTIAASVTVSQLVNVVTTVLLLIVLGVLTGSGLSKFKIAPGADVLIGLAVIAVAIIVVLAVPPTRKRVTGAVWPRLRQIWPRLLDAVSQPLRLAIAAGANLLLSAAYSLALIAALWSVGAHPAILAAAVVFLAGNTVGSATPTPGGLGGVEAVLAAGPDGHRHPGAPGDTGGAPLPHGNVLAAHPDRLDQLPRPSAARCPVAAG